MDDTTSETPADTAGAQPTPAQVAPTAPAAVVTSTPDSPPPAVSSNVQSAGTVSAGADEYISNPFLNSVRGLVLTLKTNPTPALLSGLIGLLILAAGSVVYLIAILALKSPAIAFILLVILAIIYMIPVGTYYVIAGSSARDEEVTTGESYRRAAGKVFPLIVLSIISAILTAIGFILLIIPGVIFLARSSLSPLVMFEEDLGPIAALKRSFSLTKGHVNEMLGAYYAAFFLGGGYSLLFGAISVAPLVGRYHDLRQLKESGAPKPPVHWLNYLYLLMLLLFVGGVVLAIANS